jgi:hypothetical protein
MLGFQTVASGQIQVLERCPGMDNLEGRPRLLQGLGFLAFGFFLGVLLGLFGNKTFHRPLGIKGHEQC